MLQSRLGFTLIVLLVCSSVVAKEPKELFNGKDLSGWEGDARIWTVDDAIVGSTQNVPLNNNTFLIWKGGDVKDFKLTLKFKIEGGKRSNSGIQYRSQIVDPHLWIVGGYQADIDKSNEYTGILYDERGRGFLARRGERATISPGK